RSGAVQLLCCDRSVISSQTQCSRSSRRSLRSRRRAGPERCYGSCVVVQESLLYFTTGGVSKVWKGAGERSDHSRPVAPSHDWAAACSPILREALITSHRKISCDRPNQKAPIVAIMLKSVNCAA